MRPACCRRNGVEHEILVPLTIVDSPFREVTRPVVQHFSALRRERPRDVVTVFIPEYVVTRWWRYLLHNQSALRLKARLLFTPAVMVVSVPCQLGATGQVWLAEPAARQGADLTPARTRPAAASATPPPRRR